MKQKLLLLFAFSFSTIYLQASVKFNFSEKGGKWNVYMNYTCQEAPAPEWMVSYSIGEDTIIDEITYSKFAAIDQRNNNITTQGAIREEGSKVYYRGWTVYSEFRENDVLLYDFDVKAGDVVQHAEYFKSKVELVDSIEINGKFRKRIILSESGFGNETGDVWIEGIGSVQKGILNNVTDIPTCGYHNWKHICYSENEQVLFLNPDFNQCYPSYLMSNKIMVDENINVHYFNDSKLLIIEVNTPKTNSTFKVYDILGKELMVESLCNHHNTIDFSSIKGMVIIQVLDELNRLKHVQKLMVQ